MGDVPAPFAIIVTDRGGDRHEAAWADGTASRAIISSDTLSRNSLSTRPSSGSNSSALALLTMRRTPVPPYPRA